MATKTKKTKTNTTSNRSNATTICGNANTTSTKRNPIGRPATVTAQMAKGAMGALEAAEAGCSTERRDKHGWRQTNRQEGREGVLSGTRAGYRKLTE